MANTNPFLDDLNQKRAEREFAERAAEEKAKKSIDPAEAERKRIENILNPEGALIESTSSLPNKLKNVGVGIGTELVTMAANVASAADMNKKSYLPHADRAKAEEVAKAIDKGTATPEQMAWWNSPIKHEGGRLTDGMEDPYGRTYSQGYKDLRQRSHGTDNPVNTFMKELVTGSEDPAIKKLTWAEIAEGKIGSLYNDEATQDILENESLKEGQKAFSDGLMKVQNSDNIGDKIKGALQMIGSTSDLGLGVIEAIADDPVDALAVTAKEIGADLALTAAGRTAGAALNVGESAGQATAAYQEAERKLIEKHGVGVLTPEVERDLRIKAAAIGAVDTASDKLIGDLFKYKSKGKADTSDAPAPEGKVDKAIDYVANSKRLSARSIRTLGTGYTEGMLEATQSLIQATMDQEGISAEEAISAYQEGAIGMLVGSTSKVASKPAIAAGVATAAVAKPVTKAFYKGLNALDVSPEHVKAAAEAIVNGSVAVGKGAAKALDYIDRNASNPSEIAKDIINTPANMYKFTMDKLAKEPEVIDPLAAKKPTRIDGGDTFVPRSNPTSQSVIVSSFKKDKVILSDGSELSPKEFQDNYIKSNAPLKIPELPLGTVFADTKDRPYEIVGVSPSGSYTVKTWSGAVRANVTPEQIANIGTGKVALPNSTEETDLMDIRPESDYDTVKTLREGAEQVKRPKPQVRYVAKGDLEAGPVTVTGASKGVVTLSDGSEISPKEFAESYALASDVVSERKLKDTAADPKEAPIGHQQATKAVKQDTTPIGTPEPNKGYVRRNAPDSAPIKPAGMLSKDELQMSDGSIVDINKFDDEFVREEDIEDSTEFVPSLLKKGQSINLDKWVSKTRPLASKAADALRTGVSGVGKATDKVKEVPETAKEAVDTVKQTTDKVNKAVKETVKETTDTLKQARSEVDKAFNTSFKVATAKVKDLFSISSSDFEVLEIMADGFIKIRDIASGIVTEIAKVDLQAMIDAAKPKSQPKETKTKSDAQTTYLSAKRDPDTVSDEVIEDAIEDEENDLTDEQRAELQAILDIKQAVKSVATNKTILGVSDELSAGNRTERGLSIREYIEEIREAVNSEDFDTAARLYNKFSRWNIYRQRKAVEYRHAFTTHTPVTIAGKEPKWINSKELVETVEVEAKLMQKLQEGFSEQINAAGGDVDLPIPTKNFTEKYAKVLKKETSPAKEDNLDESSKGTKVFKWGSNYKIDEISPKQYRLSNAILPIIKSWGYRVGATRLNSLRKLYVESTYSGGTVAVVEGTETTDTGATKFKGPVGWDIAFSIRANSMKGKKQKPIYVFNQQTKEWSKYDYTTGDFVATTAKPTIYANTYTAGKLNEAGKKEINSLKKVGFIARTPEKGITATKDGKAKTGTSDWFRTKSGKWAKKSWSKNKKPTTTKGKKKAVAPVKVNMGEIATYNDGTNTHKVVVSGATPTTGKVVISIDGRQLSVSPQTLKMTGKALPTISVEDASYFVDTEAGKVFSTKTGRQVFNNESGAEMEAQILKAASKPDNLTATEIGVEGEADVTIPNGTVVSIDGREAILRSVSEKKNGIRASVVYLDTGKVSSVAYSSLETTEDTAVQVEYGENKRKYFVLGDRIFSTSNKGEVYTEFDESDERTPEYKQTKQAILDLAKVNQEEEDVAQEVEDTQGEKEVVEEDTTAPEVIEVGSTVTYTDKQENTHRALYLGENKAGKAVISVDNKKVVTSPDSIVNRDEDNGIVVTYNNNKFIVDGTSIVSIISGKAAYAGESGIAKKSRETILKDAEDIKAAIEESEQELDEEPDISEEEDDVVSEDESVVEPAATNITLVAPKGSKGTFLVKDQIKADASTQFIGKGSKLSSTNAYMQAYGDLANTGKYTSADKVFVSVEGLRSNRVTVNAIRAELFAAIEAGASIIADNPSNRKRQYNIGERDLAAYLESKGYVENVGPDFSTWTKKTTVKPTADLKTKPEPKPKQETVEDIVEQYNDVNDDSVDAEDLSEKSATQDMLDNLVGNTEGKLGLVNLVKAYFKRGNNKSALDGVTNIISTVGDDFEKISKYDPQWGKTDKKATIKAWKAFRKFHVEASKSFPELFAKLPDAKEGAASDYKYKDYLQYLVNKGGVLPENVKVAITSAIYQYMLIDAGASQMKSYDEVKAILGLAESDSLPSDVYNDLKRKGDSIPQIKRKLGKAAYKALNLKPTDDAGINFASNMESALGNMAFAILADRKYVRIHTEALEIPQWGERAPIHKSVSLARANMLAKSDSNRTTVKPIIEAAGEDTTLLSRIFSTPYESSMPSFHPVKAPKRFKGTSQLVPPKMREAINKYNKQPRMLYRENVDMFMNLDKKTQQSLLGYVHDLDTLVKGKRAAAESVNNDIDRAISSLTAFVKQMEGAAQSLETNFFFKNIPWSNNRLGVDGSVNMQTNKMLHRFMMGSPNWRTTIKLDDKSAVDTFTKTVAAGFDITDDKNQLETVKKKFNELRETTVFKEGITATRAAMAGKPHDNEAILRLAEKGEAKAHTLVAMVTWVKYEDAKKNKASDFSYTLSREGDGITNGVAFGLIQFASKMNKTYAQQLERVGLFASKDSGGFAEAKEEQGLLDSYQNFALIMDAAVNEFNDEKDVSRQLNAITATMGSFIKVDANGVASVTSEGRNASKPILMTFIYGAGIASLVNKLSLTFSDKVYTTVQDFVDGNNDVTKAEVLRVFNEVNNLLGYESKSIGDLNALKKMKVADLRKHLLEFEFSDKDMTGIYKEYMQVYKKPLKVALEAAFPDLTQGSKAAIEAMGAAYKVYKAVYDQELQKLRDAIPSDKDSPTGNEAAIRDVTRKEYAEFMHSLLNVTPIINTPLSDGDLNSGLMINKIQEVVPTSNTANAGVLPSYQQVSKFKRKITQVTSKSNHGGYPVTSQTGSLTLNSFQRVPAEPGVGGLPISVHSLDATAMYGEMLKGGDFANIFDALMSGDSTFTNDMQSLNQSFMSTNKDFSLPVEISNMLNRVIENAKEFGIDPSTMVIEHREDGASTIAEIAKDFEEKAKQFAANKAEAINSINYWGQYYAGAESGYIAKDSDKVTVDVPKAETKPKTKGQEVKKTLDEATNAPKTDEELDINSDDIPPWETTESYKEKIEQALERDAYIERDTKGRNLIGQDTRNKVREDAKQGKAQILEHEDEYHIIWVEGTVSMGDELGDGYPRYLESLDGTSFIIQKKGSKPEVAQDILFSPKTKTANGVKYKQGDDVTAESSRRIFDTLADQDTLLSKEHRETLDNVLANVINKVIQPTKLWLAKSGNSESYGMMTGEDVFIVTGSNPKSTATNHLSSAEVYVHELVHRVMSVGTAKPLVRSELNKLWRQAKAKVTIRDLMNDPTLSEDSEEYKVAEAQWKHMFEPTILKGNRSSNHLEEFATMGITNTNVIKALAKEDNKEVENPTNFLGTLRKLLDTTLKYIRSKILGTHGKTMDKQVETLVMQIAGVENDTRNALTKAAFNVAETIGGALAAINKPLKAAIESILASDTAKKTGNSIDKAYTNILMSKNPLANAMASILNETKGRTQNNGVFHDLKRKGDVAINRESKAVQQAIKDSINDQFAEPLSEHDSSAISQVFLATNFTVIVEAVGFDVAMALYTNPAKRNTLANQLINTMTPYELVQAQNLGRYMSTGINSLHGAMLNGNNIAKGDEKKAKQVDILASLYAINYADNGAKAWVNQEVFKKDPEYKGLRFMMELMVKGQQDARDIRFKGKSGLMTAGHITANYNDVQQIVGTEADREKLEGLGFTKSHVLPKDPKDKSKTVRVLYVNQRNIQPSIVEGVMNFAKDTSKGYAPLQGTSLKAAIHVIDSLDAHQYAQGFQPSDVSLMTPLTNSKGKIVDLRYQLDNKTKDELLLRQLDAADIVAGLYASNAVYKAKKTQNVKVVNALYDQYKADLDKGTTEKYITISPENNREMWFKFTPEVQKQIIKKFGSPVLQLRKDHVDLLFGYQKYSVGEAFMKDKEMRNAFENIVVNTATALLGKSAGAKLTAMGATLANFVSLTKDVLVVRSGVLTIANTFSNVLLLAARGVSPARAVTDIASVPADISRYQKAEAELRKLKLVVDTLNGERKSKAQSRIAELTTELNTNPVAILIQGGALSESFEDLTSVGSMREGLEQLMNISKAAINTKFDRDVTPSTGPSVEDKALDVFAALSLDKGTKGHQVMADAARYSDFVARYSYYNHLVEQGMPSEQAIGKVMDTFIYYELPTNKGLQYLNDIGALLFTKYFLRVQKIILETFRENPASALSTVLFNYYTGIGSGIWSSSIIESDIMTRVNSPANMMDMLSSDPLSQTVDAAYSYATA